MNKLSLDKKSQIIRLLVEGNSLRSCTRIADVSKGAVTKLMVAVGKACWDFHDQTVVNVNCRKIQADEIWSFVYSKEKNKPEGLENAGDVWTWVGIDADTKLAVSWMVGNRDADCANTFMHDLASRLSHRVQLTTDGLRAYLEAVTDSFGSQIDFAQLQKIYGGDPSGSKTERKYSPAICIGSKKAIVSGNPDPAHISTSYVERQNLTMRMSMRRFTRLTNAFSKKLENHCFAIALHFVHYNFVRIHKTLRITPAMAAGLTKRFMTIEDIAILTEAQEPKPTKRGPYKKRELISK